MVTPTPMDIDALNQHGEDEDGWGYICSYGAQEGAGKILNLLMVLSQWEREVVKVLGKARGREMGVAIFVDNLGIGPGNAQATPKEGKKEKGLVRAGRGQTNMGMVKVMERVLVGKVLVVKVMVKVLGTKVHVSIAIKLDIDQQSARMRDLLRFLRLGQKSKLVVLR